MKTEKNYIVITRYAMRSNNIGIVILDTIEDAMAEATAELSGEYTKRVEIFETDRAQRIFFGKRIFNKIKR